MEICNLSAKSYAILTVLYYGVKEQDGFKRKDLRIPEVIDLVKRKFKIDDLTQSYVYSLFEKLIKEDIIVKRKFNDGYDIRYTLSSEGNAFYKKANRLFLSITKANVESLMEAIKDKTIEEKETIILELADNLSRYTDIRYTINKQKK